MSEQDEVMAVAEVADAPETTEAPVQDEAPATEEKEPDVPGADVPAPQQD